MYKVERMYSERHGEDMWWVVAKIDLLGQPGYIGPFEHLNFAVIERDQLNLVFTSKVVAMLERSPEFKALYEKLSKGEGDA